MLREQLARAGAGGKCRITPGNELVLPSLIGSTRGILASAGPGREGIYREGNQQGQWLPYRVQPIVKVERSESD